MQFECKRATAGGTGRNPRQFYPQRDDRPAESHLIPLIPRNPTYPTESQLSQGIPVIPRNPACPTESQLSRGIPLIPPNPNHPTYPT